jgi:large subunit ribosomal protein L17
MRRVIRAQSDFRQTQLRNQLTSLVLYESVTTTLSKAQELVPFANRFFNKVRAAGLNEKKLAHATLFDANAIAKVFEEILPRYAKKETTFVRGVKTAPRKGDAAAQMIVTLLSPLKAKAEEAAVGDSKAKKPAKKDTNGKK